MIVTPELAFTVALIALLGVLVTALVTIFIARRRGDLDERLLKLKAQLDAANTAEMANVQHSHAERLAKLEHSNNLETEERARILKADGTRLKALLETLDPKQIISFLRDHDFGGAFRREEIFPLYRFVERADDPDQDFLDPEIEEIRRRLISAARVLSNNIALKTWPTVRDFNSARPNDVPPARGDTNARELNDAATKFVGLFDELVRRARAKSDT